MTHFGEYSLHMQVFYFLPFLGSVQKADIEPYKHDKRWFVNAFSWILGVLGF